MTEKQSPTGCKTNPKTLRLQLITWNVFGSSPSKDLSELLGLDQTGKGDHAIADIYAIGLQELPISPYSTVMGMIFSDPWTMAFKKSLAAYDFVLMHSIRLGWMSLLLFVRRIHLHNIRNIHSGYTRTGFRGFLGNKGGVSETFTAYDTCICIVNCHLAAHDNAEGFKQRIQDFHSIVEDQPFINSSDYVFWMGDANFRIPDFTGEQINDLISRGELNPLLEKDDLTKVISSKMAFDHFQEMPIRFKPTYKYFVNGTQYDISRKPAWTDRILYKTIKVAGSAKLGGEEYKSHENYMQSDHKPVGALFSIAVNDFTESPVKFDPMDPWRVGENGICGYTRRDDMVVSAWDWIGLFKAGFSDISEYATWIYAAHPSETGTLRGTFAEVLAAEGDYHLLYFSGDTRDLLGMSDSFQIIKKS